MWRVEAPPEAYGEVFAAARAAGVRLGWLDLAATVAMPTDLDTAAAAGVLRAVAVGSGGTVAVKPLAGAPVLRDLLREHFLGCGAVLVRGEVEGELLAPAPSGWRVGEGEAVGAEALLRGLRSCGTTERRQALSGGAGHRG